MLTNGVISTVLAGLCTVSLLAGGTAVVKTYTNDTRITSLEATNIGALRINVAVAEQQITAIKEDVEEIKDSQEKTERNIEAIKEDNRESNEVLKEKLRQILEKLP